LGEAHLALGVEVELAEHEPGEPPGDQPERRAELESVHRTHTLVLNALPQRRDRIPGREDGRREGGKQRRVKSARERG